MSDNPISTEPDWEHVQRVLVIMAHPDDPDFSCGGTAMQMVRRGIEVTYMILTNGDKGNHDPEITREQLIEMRKREQRAAAAVEGVQHVLFMGEEDGFLQPNRDLRKRVVREIRRIRPELIVCPSPDRYLGRSGNINHPDHRNAGLVALEAIFPAADNMMFFPDLMDEGYMPFKLHQLYITGDPEPTLQIDITADAEQKIKAILCHKSQFPDPEATEKRWRERWGEEQEDGTKRHYERFRVITWPLPKPVEKG